MPPAPPRLRFRFLRPSLTRGGLAMLLLAWLSPASAPAQAVADNWSARALGMGGAYRALADDGAATDLNPAALATFRRYHLQVDYRLHTPTQSHLLNLSVVDNLTSSVGASVLTRVGWANAVPGRARSGWVVVGESPETVQLVRTQDYKVGAGVPLSSHLALGTSVGWHRVRQAEPSRFDETGATSVITLDAAIQLRASPHFSFALVGNQLAPSYRIDLPTTATLAASAQAGKLLMAEVDLTGDFTSRRDLARRTGLESGDIALNVHLGGMALLRRFFPVRLGYYSVGAYGARYVTGGLGVDAPGFSLSYAAQLVLEHDEGVASRLGDRLTHGISLSGVMGGK